VSKSPFSFVLFSTAAYLVISGTNFRPAAAATATYTSSAAFYTAIAGDTVTQEQYASGTLDQLIANGGVFNGLTYTFTAGPSGALTGGIITDIANSFSALSLGGNQTDGSKYFFGGDSVTINFATPVYAAGAFFNVNLNSGNFGLSSTVGFVNTDSSIFDTETFVFAGITSTTAFSSITLYSDDPDHGSFNIPEIDFVSSTPLPASLPLFASGLGAFGLLGWSRKKKAAALAA